jgi:hypothetical protein
MATTNRIAPVLLTLGTRATVALVPAAETLALQLTTVQVVQSQVRLLVKDTLGEVRASTVLNGTGVIKVLIDKIAAQTLTAEVECLLGSVQIRLDEITGIEAASGAATIDADDIANASLATAKLAAGAVTLTKISGFATLKCLSAAGRVGAGVIALVGTAVGDRLVAAFGSATAGGALLPIVNNASVFEATVTVINEIQQTSVANLAAFTYVFLLAPAAA